MIKEKVDIELKLLLKVIPPRIKKVLETQKDLPELIEVVLDLGKPPEARFVHRIFYIEKDTVLQEDIDFVTEKVGEFTKDNRSGIERTLHRISAIRNRRGKIVGLTLRIGRAVFGTTDIIRDVVESGKNILILGPPGIGKTTILRESARILADTFNKRVVVVDTSNEIGGDGDIPHPGIGRSRRMQVSSPDRQHAVMIEAVENHMPEVIVVDEIGTEAEAIAARTIAERGVQLIGTAHGISLDNILNNPTLSDLLGGIQTVILGDEEAKRRHTQKAILERKAQPTFDIAVEIRTREMFAVYHNVAKAVDRLLLGKPSQPEIRVRGKDGTVKIKETKKEGMPELTREEEERALSEKGRGPLKIYLFGVNKVQLERGLRTLELPAIVVGSLDDADLVLTVKAKAKTGCKIVKLADEHDLPLHVIRKNVSSQIMRFLKYYFKVGSKEDAEDFALREAEDAIRQVRNSRRAVDLSAQNAYIRRLQHQLAAKHKLRSESVGEEPKRRLRIYPS